MTQGNEHEQEKAPPPRDNGDMRPDDGHADAIDGADGVFLEPHIQEQLGRVLRSFCDDLVQQPIPDKFVVLLAQLEAKQREKK
ncbi:MAG: NepR family anti-sigma factor [Methylocystis sp.]|uniref:NepR family anti-sigma factor n=1 Tax=Methylocystis sp. TaxID=1911079 RepID=UPI003DA23811